MLMPQIVKEVKEHGDHCERYGGFIAVDVIILRPHIYFTREGFIEGLMTDSVELTPEDVRELKSSYIKYDDFVRSFENKPIGNSFVYIYQPIVADTK